MERIKFHGHRNTSALTERIVDLISDELHLLLQCLLALFHVIWMLNAQNVTVLPDAGDDGVSFLEESQCHNRILYHVLLKIP